MASANVTISGSGNGGFECDENAKTATLLLPGGVVTNKGLQDAYINVDNGSLVTSEPLGGSMRKIPPGASVQLPPQCWAYKFGCAAGLSTSLMHDR
ncbi:MAG: hypothetical protein KIS92_00915 [Planctomycetota bacterium]|nr:hypothetical protein [Planctomycetota bacterium]